MCRLARIPATMITDPPAVSSQPAIDLPLKNRKPMPRSRGTSVSPNVLALPPVPEPGGDHHLCGEQVAAGDRQQQSAAEFVQSAGRAADAAGDLRAFHGVLLRGGVPVQWAVSCREL
jgi:hypothetical protein